MELFAAMKILPANSLPRKTRVFLTALVFLLGVTGEATAAPWATGPLTPPLTGVFACGLANVSTTKTVEFTITFYSFNATVLYTASSQLLPGRNTRYESLSAGTQAHCVVDVTKGGKKNLRVTGMALDSNSRVVAAVPAQ